MKLISLFTGFGGLDFGFEAAGFETAVALEMDKTACETLRLNRSWPVLEGDIHDFTSRTILETAKLQVGEADIVVGGPPCQPFSKSGYWARGDSLRLDDPRAGTLTAYLRVLRDTLPRVFLLENVFGLAYKGKDEGLRHLLDGIEQIRRQTGTRYSVSWQVLNAAAYGVPQQRERIFIVGSRNDREFRFPVPTHGAVERITSDLLPVALEPYRTAWDAIGDLSGKPNEGGLDVRGQWGDLLPSVPEGQNYLFHTDRGGGRPLFGWRTRYWSFLLKLAKAQPSWTIQAQPGSAIGPFHWTSRRLSIREMCRLQTVPDDLMFRCGRTEAQRMLGNAVPSLLAEVIAREIRKQLLDSPVTGPLKLLPPARPLTPLPEPIAPVPERYLHLEGAHAAHPGTGRGRAASKRKAVQVAACT